jgi:PHD/YefM family antitoxin component YafN of YafNO toxin-antitoxin module
MRSIPAREIKRRGISAVDEQLKDGPVYIIKNDEPSYVVLSRAQYEWMTGLGASQTPDADQRIEDRGTKH